MKKGISLFVFTAWIAIAAQAQTKTANATPSSAETKACCAKNAVKSDKTKACHAAEGAKATTTACTMKDGKVCEHATNGKTCEHATDGKACKHHEATKPQSN
jgi:hypothetical protein